MALIRFKTCSWLFKTEKSLVKNLTFGMTFHSSKDNERAMSSSNKSKKTVNRYKDIWHDVDLEFKPVLLGGIFRDAAENSATVGAPPLKQKYLHSDILRCSKYYNVDLRSLKKPMEALSKGSMAPMRCVTVCKMYYPEYLISISREFWKKRWHNDEDFTSDEAITEIIKNGTRNKNLDIVSDIKSKMQTQEVKDKLKETTKEAVEKGVSTILHHSGNGPFKVLIEIFGVPTMLVDNGGEKKQLFWGADRLPMVAYELNVTWVGPNPDKPQGRL